MKDNLLLANEVRCNQKLQIEEQKTQWHKTKMDIKAINGRQDTIQKSRNGAARTSLKKGVNTSALEGWFMYILLY
jgi:hypothetical protein